METIIRPKTVKFISRFLRPLTDEGVITVGELNEIIAQLQAIAKKGELINVQPRLIDRKELASLLSLSVSNLKALESRGELPIRQIKIGGAIRYRLTEAVKWIMAGDCGDPEKTAL